MKKLITLVAACFVMLSANAGNESIIGINKKKEIISNGFYLHAGIGFPSISSMGFKSSLGVQPSFEFGNQWMFYKNSNWGIGMNVSWLTLGFSSKSESTLWGSYTSYSAFFNFMKFGPMASFGLNDDMAFDVYFNIAPTFYVNIEDYDEGITDSYFMYGAAFTPGAKFRFKKLAVGFEAQIGNLRVTEFDADELVLKVSYFNPRILVGFKF